MKKDKYNREGWLTLIIDSVIIYALVSGALFDGLGYIFTHKNDDLIHLKRALFIPTSEQTSDEIRAAEEMAGYVQEAPGFLSRFPAQTSTEEYCARSTNYLYVGRISVDANTTLVKKGQDFADCVMQTDCYLDASDPELGSPRRLSNDADCLKTAALVPGAPIFLSKFPAPTTVEEYCAIETNHNYNVYGSSLAGKSNDFADCMQAEADMSAITQTASTTSSSTQ